MNWKNKKVIVTGGSTGIGAQLVQELSEKGAHVVFCGHLEEQVNQTSQKLESHGITANLCKDNELVSFFTQAVDKLGGLDILVNNAGFAVVKPFEELLREDFEHMYAINAIAPARLAQLATPYFLEKGEGDIVNMGATGAYYAFDKGTAYGSSKAALSFISKNISLEMRHKGIRVFHIDPSWVTDTFNYSGNYIPKDEEKLNPTDITASIIHTLEMPRRAFVPQMSIWGSKS